MIIKNGVLQNVNIQGVTFKADIIPKGRKRRPGFKLKGLDWITIHNTGCPNVKADNFRRVQLDVSQDKEVSWHFTVDNKEIIQSLPINEVAWHAGTTNGNFYSIGIEVCEVKGAEQVAIKFVAQLLETLGKGVDKVRTHKSWSGKECPHLILPHWNEFINAVGHAMGSHGNDNDKLAEYAQLLGKRFGINPVAWSNVEKINLKNVPSLLSKLGGTVNLVKDGVISDELLWERGKYSNANVASLIIKAAQRYCKMKRTGTTTANLNVRETPYMTANILGVIPKGGAVIVTGFENDFYEIVYNNKKAYVSKKYVQLNKED